MKPGIGEVEKAESWESCVANSLADWMGRGDSIYNAWESGVTIYNGYTDDPKEKRLQRMRQYCSGALGRAMVGKFGSVNRAFDAFSAFRNALEHINDTSTSRIYGLVLEIPQQLAFALDQDLGLANLLISLRRGDWNKIMVRPQYPIYPKNLESLPPVEEW